MLCTMRLLPLVKVVYQVCFNYNIFESMYLAQKNCVETPLTKKKGQSSDFKHGTQEVQPMQQADPQLHREAFQSSTLIVAGITGNLAS